MIGLTPKVITSQWRTLVENWSEIDLYRALALKALLADKLSSPSYLFRQKINSVSVTVGQMALLEDVLKPQISMPLPLKSPSTQNTSLAHRLATLRGNQSFTVANFCIHDVCNSSVGWLFSHLDYIEKKGKHGPEQAHRGIWEKIFLSIFFSK